MSAWQRVALNLIIIPPIHPSVTDLVKPDLVGYFALPGGIKTSLAPGGSFKNSLVNFIPPWCRILVSLVRRAHLQEKVTSLEFRSCFRYMKNSLNYPVLHVICCCTKGLRAWKASGP